MRFIFFRDPLHSILTSPGAFLRSPVELIHRHSFCANMPLQKFLACQPSMAPKKVFVDGWLSENRVPKKNLVTSFCMLKYIAIWRLYKGYTTFSDKPTKNEFPVSPITCFDLPCQLSFTLPAPSSWCIGPGDCSSFQPAPSSCRSLKIGSPSQKKKVVCHDDMAVCQNQ